jgi:hypothetical protein
MKERESLGLVGKEIEGAGLIEGQRARNHRKKN